MNFCPNNAGRVQYGTDGENYAFYLLLQLVDSLGFDRDKGELHDFGELYEDVAPLEGSDLLTRIYSNPFPC